MSKYYVEIEHETGSAGFETAKIAAFASHNDTLTVTTESGTMQFAFRSASLAQEAFREVAKAKEAVA